MFDFLEVSEFLLFLLPGAVESAGIVACSLALVRVKLRWTIIIPAASTLATIIYLIRHMPVTFGLHTIAGFLLLVMFLTKGTRVPPSSSFMASFISYAILASLERLMIELSVMVLKTDINNIMSDYLLWTVLSLPQGVLMVAIALLIAKIRTPLEGMWRIR
ncbi:hypothetical protein [Desulfoscipio geothermicus]|nr:hypothetical protein [Desulfoscipio geothermicus]